MRQGAASQDAAAVIRAAVQMLANYEDEAVPRAEARARDLESDPAGAARWHLVADTIRLLSDRGFAA